MAMDEHPQRIAIVTDSTADLPEEVCSRLRIRVIPLNVHFGDETFRDGVDLTVDEFLQRLTTASDLPTTSQASPAVFEQAFRELAADHDAIICVLISSKLSGTIQSAQIAADAVADVIRVEIVDSLNSTLAQGLQVVRARELADQAIPLADIVRTLRAETNSYHLVFFAETLEYLHRGGRIGKAAALFGSILQLKPLLRVEEGMVIPFERTRTRKKALAGLESFADSFGTIERAAGLHITTPDDAQALIDKIRPRAAHVDIPIGRIGPVLALHIGPGAVGVVIKEPT
jgi:DegV family protein with EDD domain